ncbi:MAG: type 4a pilus biogenesis protein PilO [Campylobacterales bacterium]|nr:type 4a pilus biogenesis protein PilO [Campylobacterales bacterium]
MSNKNILILLISLTLFINFINYIDEDESKTLKKIEALKKRIAQEKALLGEKVSLDTKDSTKLFFDSTQDNNRLLGAFQNEIKAIADRSGFKINNITWGEPTVNEKLKLVTIPLKLSAITTPHYFAEFLNALKAMDKIVKIDMITMGKSRKEISYQMYLFGYKRIPNAQK